MKQTPDRESYSFSELDLSGSGAPALIQRVLQYATGMHSHHDFLELVLIIEGSCVHTLSTGTSYSLGAGDFFFIPTGIRHSYEDVNALKLVNVLVKRQFLEGILEGLQDLEGFALVIAETGSFKRPVPLPKNVFDTCLEIVNRIEAESWEVVSGRDWMLKSLLTELFIRLFRAVFAVKGGASLRALPDFGRIADYMENHIQKQANVAEMAKAGGVSTRTLLRRFKMQTGLSPMEYLNQMRLSKACRLLRESPLGIKQIAIACGFPDSNYFARQYRKTLGVSPRDFRKAYVALQHP
jgi:AraC-like DNA-binding protein/mannose-6-phosphate isomerase-like protein (cupin superfamily)